MKTSLTAWTADYLFGRQLAAACGDGQKGKYSVKLSDNMSMIVRTLLMWGMIAVIIGVVARGMSGDIMTGYDVLEFFRELLHDILNIQDSDVIWILGRLILIWLVAVLSYAVLQTLLQPVSRIFQGKLQDWKYWKRRRWEEREAKRRRPILEAEQRRREEEQAECERLVLAEKAEKQADEEARKQAALKQLGKLGKME